MGEIMKNYIGIQTCMGPLQLYQLSYLVLPVKSVLHSQYQYIVKKKFYIIFFILAKTY